MPPPADARSLNVLVIDAGGSPRDIGRMRGSAARAQIPLSLQITCGFDLEEATCASRLEHVRRRLAFAMPHVLEEADGLAEGAGISGDEALALSVSIDLCNRLPGYCSLLALSSGAGVLLAKNQDTRAEMAPLQVVERVRPDEGLAYLNFTLAGAMWTDGGVNAAGLALVCSSLTPERTNPDGLPDGVVIREVLRVCSTVGQAADYLKKTPPMSLGENILVADASGQARRIQSMPHGFSSSEGLPLVACNHPADPRLVTQMAPYDPISANSHAREARLTSELSSAPQSDPMLLARSLLRSVFQSGDDALWTVANVFVRPESGSLGTAIYEDWKDAGEHVPVEWVELDAG
jgi:isopenicillin-N N-acyltransferase like protein